MKSKLMSIETPTYPLALQRKSTESELMSSEIPINLLELEGKSTESKLMSIETLVYIFFGCRKSQLEVN